RRNKRAQRSQQDQANDATTQCSNATSVKANNTTQTGQTDNLSTQSSEATTKTYSVIVLGVSMHCEGCADTVKQHLHSFDGIQQVEIDMSNHKVTVRGKIADPKMVVERLRRRTNNRVALISPVLKEKTEKEIKEEKRKEELRNKPMTVEVVLKVYMHCEGCAQDIKSRIHKMKGVLTVLTNMSTSQVTVKGAFEPHQLVEYINKKIGKHATIVKKTPPTKKEGDNKNEEQGKKMDIKDYYQMYPPGLVYAPQLFSEENPNACSIM
ncbi:Heavy metal-associated isoprenylated plant protein, partial [Actinidia chinensis var. chinensis]